MGKPAQRHPVIICTETGTVLAADALVYAELTAKALEKAMRSDEDARTVARSAKPRLRLNPAVFREILSVANGPDHPPAETVRVCGALTFTVTGGDDGLTAECDGIVTQGAYYSELILSCVAAAQLHLGDSVRVITALYGPSHTHDILVIYVNNDGRHVYTPSM